MSADLMTMTDDELEREQHVTRNGIWQAKDDRVRTDRCRKLRAICDEWERRYQMRVKRIAK